MNPQKEKAIRRLNYQVLLMKKHMRKHKISNKEVSLKSGIPTSIIWKFINGKSKEVTAFNFLMIAEAIGYEISMNLKKE